MSAGPSPCAMLNNKGDVHYIVAPANKNRIYRLMLTEPRTGTGCTQAGTNGSRHAHTHALIRSSWRRARGGKEKKTKQNTDDDVLGFGRVQDGSGAVWWWDVVCYSSCVPIDKSKFPCDARRKGIRWRNTTQQQLQSLDGKEANAVGWTGAVLERRIDRRCGTELNTQNIES